MTPKLNWEAETIAALKRASVLEALQVMLDRYRTTHWREPELVLLNRSLRAPIIVELVKAGKSAELSDPLEFDNVRCFFSISKDNPVFIKMVDKEHDIEIKL